MRGIMAVVLPAVLVVTSLRAVPAGAQSPPQGDIAKRFFGAWRYVGTSIDGKPRPGRGVEPKGIIYYDPSGAMAAQIAPDRRVPMAGPQPTAERPRRRSPTMSPISAPIRSTSARAPSRIIARRACSPASSPIMCATMNSRAIA